MDDRLKEAAELLSLHKAAAEHGGPLKGISGMAMARLQDINREIEAERTKPGTTAPKQGLIPTPTLGEEAQGSPEPLTDRRGV